MIKYYVPNKASILFIGINPHPGSDSRGVPFSNNKMFWYILNRAGLIDEDVNDLKDDEKLKAIYTEKFGKAYNYGLVNLIDRPTKDTSMIKKDEELEGIERIKSIVKRKKPLVVCFIGKVTYSKFSKEKSFELGFQPKKLYDSMVFVASFPIRGYASIRIDEMKKIFKYVKENRDNDSNV